MKLLKELGMMVGILSVMIGACVHEQPVITLIFVLVGGLMALPGIIEANRC